MGWYDSEPRCHNFWLLGGVIASSQCSIRPSVVNVGIATVGHCPVEKVFDGRSEHEQVVWAQHRFVIVKDVTLVRLPMAWQISIVEILGVEEDRVANVQ